MKRIIAIINPVMRDEVVAALHNVKDFPGASMTEAKGIRRGVHQKREERIEPLTLSFPDYIRLEILCLDTLVETLVDAIRSNAYTGKHGDGIIAVSPVETVLKICDGTTNEAAL